MKYGDWYLHDYNHSTEPNLLTGICKSDKPMKEKVVSLTEVIRLNLNPKECYTALSMISDCIYDGRISSDYEADRLEKLINETEHPFNSGFKEEFEFEIQIVVRRRNNSDFKKNVTPLENE